MYAEAAGTVKKLTHKAQDCGLNAALASDPAGSLAFIRHARDLGFSLDAIRELIALSRHPEQDCADADQIAAEQLAAVRARIAKLKRLERELDRIAACAGDKVGECGVLEALGDHGLCKGAH